MSKSFPILPQEFITPNTGEMPSRVRVLTTTRMLPDTFQDEPQQKTAATAGDVRWPLPAHPKGAVLEATFAQRGHVLSRFLPAAPLWLQQIHGVDAMKIDSGSNIAALRQTPPVADAAITHTPDVVLAILTADCLPVVIANENHQVIAVVHAGWRGLAAGILEKTVRQMDCPPNQLFAWLGPAIGPTAFEVGEDVFQAFEAGSDRDAAVCFVPMEASAKWCADLYALARLRLQRSGVSKISGGAWCTNSDAARFFSYRRQRDEGRMATFAWISAI